MLRRITAIGIALCAGIACSSAPKSVQSVEKFSPTTLRFRGAGTADFKSRGLPAARWDCETPREAFARFDFQQLQACLARVPAGQVHRFRLSRDNEPTLVMEEPEKAPECLRHRLGRIPVPREVVFVAPSDQSPQGRECWASRLDLEREEWKGLPRPGQGYVLSLSFPLQPLPQDAEETQRWLTALALSPLYEESGRKLFGVRVPETICRQCLGEKAYSEAGESGTLWP